MLLITTMSACAPLYLKILTLKVPIKTVYKAKNGRFGGRIGETGSRNTAATQKINSLTLVSYLLLQIVFR